MTSYITTTDVISTYGEISHFYNNRRALLLTNDNEYYREKVNHNRILPVTNRMKNGRAKKINLVELKKYVEFCKKHGLVLIIDNILDVLAFTDRGNRRLVNFLMYLHNVEDLELLLGYNMIQFKELFDTKINFLFKSATGNEIVKTLLNEHARIKKFNGFQEYFIPFIHNYPIQYLMNKILIDATNNGLFKEILDYVRSDKTPHSTNFSKLLQGMQRKSLSDSLNQKLIDISRTYNVPMYYIGYLVVRDIDRDSNILKKYYPTNVIGIHSNKLRVQFVNGELVLLDSDTVENEYTIKEYHKPKSLTSYEHFKTSIN